ncbi:MAG: hypothetical protein ACTSSP_01370, partial [Candidatus Asgardarchaeia archaeon]
MSDLLAITYSSFAEKFKGVDFSKSTLFLNLDCYKKMGSIEKSIEISKSFFGKVVHHVNKKPNFAQALKWCWGNNFKTPYVFHLEEDWKLLTQVNVDELIDVYATDPTIVCVRLRNIGGGREGKNDRILLAPSLFKSKFL